jgi:hypothetical protein
MRVLISKELTTVSGGNWEGLEEQGDWGKSWLTLDASDSSSSDSNIVDLAIYDTCVAAYAGLGAWFGQTVGAGAGSALPLLGTAAGAVVGRLAGGGIGGAIGENICPKTVSKSIGQIGGGSQRNTR